VDIWLERFVLAMLAAAFGSIVLLNMMKLDITQRITLGIAIGAFAYFVGHTISVTRSRNPASQSVEQDQSSQSSDAVPSQKAAPAAPHPTPSANEGATIEVTDSREKPVPGVDVLLLNADGTHSRMMTTDDHGLVEISEKAAGALTLFCAHPRFHHYRRASFDPSKPSSIQMSSSPGVGSLIIPDGTGYIPGLDGRLNPILDEQGRTYLYAQNIAIEGGKAQPAPFTVGRPFNVKDSHGHEFQLTIIDIVGSSSLVEYSSLADKRPVSKSEESPLGTVVCVRCGKRPGEIGYCLGKHMEHEFKQFGPPSDGIFCRGCGKSPGQPGYCLGQRMEHDFEQFGRRAEAIYCVRCGKRPGEIGYCLGSQMEHDFRSV
jgi:hypothetical protein